MESLIAAPSATKSVARRHNAATLPALGARRPESHLGDARAALAQAFEDVGGIPALVRWGKKNPTAFYALWSRLVPRDSNVSVTAMPLEAMLEKLAGGAGASARVVLDAAYRDVTGDDGPSIDDA